MVTKLIFALAAPILLSSCCELFGICTSVNVHTSISPPYEVASQTRRDSSTKTALTQPHAETVAGLQGPAEILP